MPVDLEAARQKVLADPNTAKIAKELKLTVEAYVETVLRFVANPGEEPDLMIMKDEDVVAQGGSVPDVGEMAKYLDQAHAAATVNDTTRFEAKGKALPAPPAAQADQSAVKAELKDAISAQVKIPRKI